MLRLPLLLGQGAGTLSVLSPTPTISASPPHHVFLSPPLEQGAGGQAVGAHLLPLTAPDLPPYSNQGAGKLSVLNSKAILEKYEPRASLVPAALNLTGARRLACTAL